AEVGRQRAEVADLRVGDLDALAPRAAARLTDGAVAAAPAEEQEFRVSGGVVDLDVRDGDAVDLGLPKPHHQVVVLRLVGDVARTVGRLEPADAVFETRGARNCELARERLRVARIRLERLAGFRERVLDGRVRADVRNAPRLRAIGDRAIGQNN